MTEQNNLPELDVRVAFIIDGVVQDVINTDARLGAIFLSQPIIVDVSENQENNFITYGWLYDEQSQTFTAPPAQETGEYYDDELPPGPQEGGEQH